MLLLVCLQTTKLSYTQAPPTSWMGVSTEDYSPKNDGAERSAEREIAEREAEVTEIGWSAERLFRRHAPLTFFDLVILATWHLDQP